MSNKETYSGSVEQSLPMEPEKLSDQDKMTLELSKMNRKLALAQAEKALAENNAAEISYKYVVLQLYMKYKLTETDGIDEQGFIVRNSVKQGQ